MTGALPVAPKPKSVSLTYAATNRSPTEVLLYVCDFYMERHLIPHPTSGEQEYNSCFVLFSVPQ